MLSVESLDGVRIGFVQHGTGSPLVLVHGTGGTAARWSHLFPILAQQYRVYAIDRRGRGMSGDADSYCFEREVEDIVAVIDSIGEPVSLIGHSFGALCALEAARYTPSLHKLVLYEPPLPGVGHALFVDGLLDRLEALLAADNREAVLTVFLREVLHMPDDAYQVYRSSPAWPARIAAVHTLPRELRAFQTYQFDAAHFRGVAVPALLLLGGDSSAIFRTSLEVIADALPASRTVVLPGQQHTAMDTAPELFVREVFAFLSKADA